MAIGGRNILLQTALIIFIALVLVTLFIFIYKRPTDKKIVALRTEIAELRAKEAEMTKKVGELPELRKEKPILEEEERLVALLIPDGSIQDSVIRFVDDISTRNSLDVVELSHEKPEWMPLMKKTEDAWTEREKKLNKDYIKKTHLMETTLTIRGKYDDLLRSLDELTFGSRFFQINELEITEPEEEEPGKVGFSLKGNLYYQGEAFPTKAPPTGQKPAEETAPGAKPGEKK